jgi:hypothetical protein
MSTVRIQVRRGTASEWTSANPTLAAGEMGVETDTRKIKVGTGNTAWTSLAYIASDAPGITEIAQDAIDSALSMGAGLTKSYNDGTNTISLNIDSSVVALKSYVDDQITGLDNAAAADYVLLADVGNAGGPAKLDVDGNLLVPKSSIILEGSSADAYETTLTVTNPTEDQTITFPNATGTVAVFTSSGDLVVPGNLTVSGDTTTLNTAELLVEDNEIILNSNVSTGAPTLSAAFSVRRGSSLPAFIQWDEVNDKWVANYGAANSKELAILDNLDSLQSTLESFTTGAVQTHESDTTNIHGIADTSKLLTTDGTQTVTNKTLNSPKINEDVPLTASATELNILYGATLSTTELNYVDGVTSSIQTQLNSKASSTDLSTHESDTTNIHGIADTSLLATKTYADSAVSTHESDTTNIHGIADTSALATKTYADSAVSTHESDTTNIHGIADTSALATKTYADNAVTQEAITTASNLGTAVSNHNSATTSVHGIADTSALATKTYVDDADNLKSNIAGPTFTGTVTIPTLSVTTTATGITATMVGLGNVDNTSDANKPVSTATQTALDAKLALAGGTMTGALTLSGAPTSDLHAVTKQYVDGLAAGINFHQPVIAATAGNLAGTYNNGTSGVGATLTKATNGSIGTIDGAAVAVGDRILLRAQTDAKENGIYTITAVGDGSNPWQITRAADSDNSPAGEVSTGDFVFVTSGSSNGSKGFLVSTTGTITIGTTNISYVQFNASEAVIAGTNITKDGATIAVENAPTFSGVITASSGVAFSDGTQTKEGVPSRTPIISKTANYTLSELSERDSLIEVDSTSPVTITIPTNSAVAYPIGTTLDILGTNTGLITIAGDTGVTVNATPGLKLRTQWSSCTLFKRATNSWVVYGDLKA